MHKRIVLIAILIIGSIYLAACNSESGNIVRWYSEEQVVKGNTLYQKDCAQCHKTDASGGPINGTDSFAPALNGTMHTWHHSHDVLRRTIKLGGAPVGGMMPGFKNKLSDSEIDSILSWVQSHWSDEIYAAWDKRNKVNQTGKK